jgi:gamma-glutamylcyclotransferase (GGCT)/AIG2-like uncharacterized protein YtfP
MKEYLFVYGTLRKDYDLKLKDKVSDDLQYVGQGKVGAVMYDIGQYPGAVKRKVIKTKSQTVREIIGDVFLINNPRKVFGVLDKYEGYSEKNIKSSEFVRKRNRVKLNSGKNINAWIYWYNYDPSDKPKIGNKDYLNYAKKKNITK